MNSSWKRNVVLAGNIKISVYTENQYYICMTKLYEIHREQQDIWTKEKLDSMTQEQKQHLIKLVKHVNPEIFEIRNEHARNSWIKILA